MDHDRVYYWLCSMCLVLGFAAVFVPNPWQLGVPAVCCGLLSISWKPATS
jgi:hypothetical protein